MYLLLQYVSFHYGYEINHSSEGSGTDECPHQRGGDIPHLDYQLVMLV